MGLSIVWACIGCMVSFVWCGLQAVLLCWASLLCEPHMPPSEETIPSSESSMALEKRPRAGVCCACQCRRGCVQVGASVQISARHPNNPSHGLHPWAHFCRHDTLLAWQFCYAHRAPVFERTSARNRLREEREKSWIDRYL